MKATLQILDEVNVKFTGLEVNTRRKLVKALEFFLPHARYLPAVRLGRWDGKVSFCDLAGRSYFHLLDKLLPIVINDGYDLAINDLRTVHEFSFTPVDEHTYAHKTWPRGHPAEGQPIILRDYQVQVINNFLTNLQSLQVSPTGSGKTIITAALSQQCEQYGRTIVIVPNKDLVVQTEKDYINLGLDVGVYFGDRKDYNRTHTICTWQSLAVLEKSTKAGTADIPIQEFVDNVVCIMVDECFAAGTLVLTPGGYRPIESFQSGDLVINYCEKTHQFKTDTVVKLHTNLPHSGSEKMYEILFDNNRSVRVTGNHKFLTTNRGWVRADELTEHDDLVENINT